MNTTVKLNVEVQLSGLPPDARNQADLARAATEAIADVAKAVRSEEFRRGLALRIGTAAARGVTSGTLHVEIEAGGTTEFRWRRRVAAREEEKR